MIYNESLDNPNPTQADFLITEGYLFKGVKLCIPRTPLRDFLIWELHARGLARHFGWDKIITLIEDRIYWSSLKRDAYIVS